MDDTPIFERVIRPRHGNRFAFLRSFLRHPNLVGSVIPSSRFLEQRIIAVAAVAKARLVVELGPGTGGTTQAILDALAEDAKLLAIEINAEFVSLLSSEPDPRLIVQLGNAGDIQDILKDYDLPRPEVIISGIPFSTTPHQQGRKILRAVWSCLAPGGHFVAYQLRSQVAQLERDLLGWPEVEVVLRNIPPLRLYHWHKPA